MTNAHTKFEPNRLSNMKVID